MNASGALSLGEELIILISSRNLHAKKLCNDCIRSHVMGTSYCTLLVHRSLNKYRQIHHPPPFNSQCWPSPQTPPKTKTQPHSHQKKKKEKTTPKLLPSNSLCTRHTHKACLSLYFLSWATMTLNMNCNRGGEAVRFSAAWQQRPGTVQLSSSEVCGGAGTLGLCEWAAREGGKKKRKQKVLHWHCIPLVMDFIINMTNYSIKVSAWLGETCKMRNIITYMHDIAKKLRHLSSLLGGLMWHFLAAVSTRDKFN